MPHADLRSVTPTSCRDCNSFSATGSTGQPKAVVLRHAQIISSCRGKLAHHLTSHQSRFLNWIAFDHVACLTEIHIHALLANAEYVEPAMRHPFTLTLDLQTVPHCTKRYCPQSTAPPHFGQPVWRFIHIQSKLPSRANYPRHRGGADPRRPQSDTSTCADLRWRGGPPQNRRRHRRPS